MKADNTSMRDPGDQRSQLLWEKLRTSLWFVPGLMASMSAVLAWLAHSTDEWFLARPLLEVPRFIYLSTADNARDVVSVLLSSMITMTSLVFSITMVVLTLAAGQFGPRLIRSFMSSPNTQFVLGTFVMTTVYCLLILGVIGSRSAVGEQAFATVSLAIVLTLISLALLVWFLHFLARSIVSETVITRVGQELEEQFSGLDPIVKEQGTSPRVPLPADLTEEARFFGPSRYGYIQAIDTDRLVRVAEKADVLLVMSFRAGDYIAAGGSGIAVYPASRCSRELQTEVLNAIIVGAHRTPTQDPEFCIRLLVEVAVRALSPAVNDPYTATAAIDQLSACLSVLLSRALPSNQLFDAGKSLRLVRPTPSYASIFAAAFSQIRQNAADKPLVLIHLLEAITRLADHVELKAQREVLQDQLEAIVAVARRTIPDQIDLDAIAFRVEAARNALKKPNLIYGDSEGKAG